MAELLITEYTDPGCPFAWSAEPIRWRLRWLYGDQLEWDVRMVGLDDARERVGRVADEAHLGFDGLWHLTAVATAA